MMRLVEVEFWKLNRSLAVALAVLAPALPGVLAAFAITSSERTMTWNVIYNQFALPIWVVFLYPMAVAAFATLAGQIEHRSNGWENMFALPVSKSAIFLAKILVCLSVAVSMTILMFGLTALGGAAGIVTSGRPPSDIFPIEELARRAPAILASTLPLTLLQIWVALRFSNFVAPLAFGIAGTFIALAVAMTNTAKADLFPWVLPFRSLLEKDPSILTVQAIAMSIAVAIVMMIDLSRAQIR
ncbi:ABC transporter permease [Sphingopyxis sp.]|uniref:ABC transporter permease n=1 Tax=Sphingopyxis sp. TaxID=1908224 RepID=UPI003D0DCF9D